MLYLIGQMFVCLLVAFGLGVLLGFVLCKMCARSGSEKCDAGAGEAASAAKSKTKAKSKAEPKAKAKENPKQPAIDGAGTDADTDTDMVDLAGAVALDGEGYDVETLQGIGPQTGKTLRNAGIVTVGDYLRKLSTHEAREEMAAKLKIKVKNIHDWASMADLLRVEGIDNQNAELLYAAGVKTVGELADSGARDLVERMDVVNNASAQLIAPSVPEKADVERWIDLAKPMKPVVAL